MEMKTLNLVYFSPTQTTQKTLRAIAEGIGLPVKEYDLTLSREIAIPAFGSDDLVIVGVPVYGGRIPVIVEDICKSLKGDGALAVAVGVYGNRHYDDAILELSDYLLAGGFTVVAAGAFVAEHSFGPEIAGGRPDTEDLAKAKQFGVDVKARVAAGDFKEIAIDGNRPYKERGAGFGGLCPSTNDDCIKCGVCVAACPVGIIDAEDPKKITAPEKCLRCNSCVKKCPTKAKFFDSSQYLQVKNMLATNFSARREPTIFF